MKTPACKLLSVAFILALLASPAGKAATVYWPVTRADSSPVLNKQVLLNTTPTNFYYTNGVGGFATKDTIYTFTDPVTGIATWTNLIVGSYAAVCLTPNLNAGQPTIVSGPIYFTITNFSQTNFVADISYSGSAGPSNFVVVPPTNTSSGFVPTATGSGHGYAWQAQQGGGGTNGNTVNVGSGLSAATNGTVTTITTNGIIVRSNVLAGAGLAASTNADKVTITTNGAPLAGNVTGPTGATVISSIPAVSGAALTSLTGANVTGTVPAATTAGSFTGSLVGDVTGTQGATVVSHLGAVDAGNLTDIPASQITGTVTTLIATMLNANAFKLNGVTTNLPMTLGADNTLTNVPAGTNGNFVIADSSKLGGTKFVDPVNLTPAFIGSAITALAAGNIASGTVATARLGSGSATSSTFLRGDQTWATPAGGSGTGASTNDAFITSGNPADLANSQALVGTANQVILTLSGSAPNQTLTASTPQNINTNAGVTFNSVSAQTVTSANFTGNGAGLTNLNVNWFNVMAYGASPVFANDSTAAIAAAAAAADAVGGTIYFPANVASGTGAQYQTTATIVLTNNGTRIMGDGMMSVLLGINATGKPLILFTNSAISTYGSVENIVLYNGNSGFNTNEVLLLSRHGAGVGSKINAHNVYFQGGCYQYQATSDAEFDISGCRFFLNPGAGTNGVASFFNANLNNSDAGDYFVHDNIWGDGGTAGWAVELTSGSGAKFTNNKFNSSGDGTHGYQHMFYMLNATGGTTSDFNIEGGSMENYLAEAIFLESTGGGSYQPWDNLIISGVQFLTPTGNAANPILLVNGQNNWTIIDSCIFRNVAAAACVNLFNMTNVYIGNNLGNVPIYQLGGTCINIQTNLSSATGSYTIASNLVVGGTFNVTGVSTLGTVNASSLGTTPIPTNATYVLTNDSRSVSLTGAVALNGETSMNQLNSNYVAQAIGTLAVTGSTNSVIDFHNPVVESLTAAADVNLQQTTNRTASVSNPHNVIIFSAGSNRNISLNTSWHLPKGYQFTFPFVLTNGVNMTITFQCYGSSETNVYCVPVLW